ncbi:MAG: UvrD-helicase domain-containing protein [bacterium]|nr:UvrD-helicase domain-containing protein [bacterium]
MLAEKKLNPEQSDAIQHGSGPLLIIAGAGTGKTTVVTERIKWLTLQELARPEEILGLTFTEKAAGEMEERIDVALPYGYTQMWVMTFHSFCDRILRDEGLAAGFDTSFKLLSETDAIALFKKHLFKFDLNYFRPLGNPNKFIGGLLQHFSRLGDEDISTEAYLSWVKKFTGEEMEKQKWQELARVSAQWSELKIKQGVMEFGDLIENALQLFRQRPNVLAKYTSKFKYILVDEFQDTNYAQNQLVNLLAGKLQNLTVVADDDQAIYRWRGAAISNVVQFRKTYPKAKLVVLTKNYRSTQVILDQAYQLIQHNNPDRLEIAEKIDKKLSAVRKTKGSKIEFLHAVNVSEEAELVVKKISELKSENPNLAYKDFAILVRANNHAEPFVRALTHAGIPQQFLGPGQLFKQSEVKDLIAYLQVLRDFTSDPAFYRVLAMPWWKISGREIVEISISAKRNNLSLFETAEKSDQANVLKVIQLIQKHLQMITSHTAGEILYDFLQESGILKAMLDYAPPIDEKQAANISKFFSRLKDFESTHEEASVSSVMDWIDLAMQLGESPLASSTDWSGNDAVNILTVHSAKGLEFEVVFVVNLVSLRFPSTDKKEPIPIPEELIKEELPTGDFHQQEERRLFYVAMTRARDRLFLTAANFYGDSRKEKKVSPFVVEALGETISTPTSSLTQPSLLDWQPSQIPVAGQQASEKVKIDYLSYTQIQTFLTCPLHYKARYILKIPTPPSAAQSFGSSIHLALSHFYADRGQDLLKLFARDWIQVGYESKQHEKLFFAKGQKLLTDYLAEEYDPKIKTPILEEMFMVPLKLNGRQIKIGGKIDRVDELVDGSIEIIDYKTGAKVPTQKEIDSDLQMSFYALAATSLRQPPLGKDPDEVKLSLYYFDAGGEKKMSTKRTTEQLHQAVAQIFDYADQISAADFKCSGSRLCQSCEYHMLCDFKTSE